MKSFVINRHGRLVFPTNLNGDLDFSLLETLDHYNTVIGRDFEAKAPTGAELLARIESGAYSRRFELLRDLAQNLFWVNRYSITMFDKRPTRWRDLPKHRDDVFLPLVTPWPDRDRKVAAVERAFRQLPPTWDGEAENRVFALLFGVFRTKLHNGAGLPAIKPTVAEFMKQPDALTFVSPGHDPDYPVFAAVDILDAHEEVPELEALTRWAMVLHNQYPWDRPAPSCRARTRSAMTTSWSPSTRATATSWPSSTGSGGPANPAGALRASPARPRDSRPGQPPLLRPTSPFG